MIPACDHIVGGGACDDCVEKECRNAQNDILSRAANLVIALIDVGYEYPQTALRKAAEQILALQHKGE